jgi:phosphoglycerate dehydrogenase-like enzyme
LTPPPRAVKDIIMAANSSSTRPAQPRIWCNMSLPDALAEYLRQQVGKADAELIFAGKTFASNLAAGTPDPALKTCDIAFGQPHPNNVIASPRVMWVHLNTAGYTRYDTDEFRSAIRSRGGIATNSSDVYAEPCAEHLLAFMMARARALPAALEANRMRQWNYEPLRAASRVVAGESALIVGYGAIGARLAAMLLALHMNVTAIRRTVRGDELVPTFAFDRFDDSLAIADHVFNMLPSAPGTKELFNADRFARMRRGAVFYNVGRGDTVDQTAMRRALESNHLAAAYLDVTTPEPLPPDDPLWTTPNVYITPHIGGGVQNEQARLVEHFLSNFSRWRKREPLLNQIV